ncbi:hypothetical protein [Hyphococcus sp.]|uniref:hypothetical protein n=1 Tax=Hyphococcus sp. TaxID=2038636 RepID=UPI0020887B3E|nr:MAG: hypothetical protein DHS20C04_07620 [Marinicaulis sp.]
MIRTISMIAATVMVFTNIALAADAPLTVDTAKRFVSSLESVESLGEEFVTNGKADKLMIDVQPKANEKFKPYSNAVFALKEKYPSDYSRLNSAVKPHGFSAEEWGAAGDRVMIAYMALKMEKENPQAMTQMQAMDPSMMAMLPPDMKQQFEQAQIMMETISSASDEDKKIVAEVADDLDDYMDRTADAHSGH